jgi:hypothetical protein
MKELTDKEHIDLEVQMVMALSKASEPIARRAYYALTDINKAAAVASVSKTEEMAQLIAMMCLPNALKLAAEDLKKLRKK